MGPKGAVRPAAIAFVAGFVLLLPCTATPVGDQLAVDDPFPLGWVSRDVLDGGAAADIAGVVFGARLYALIRPLMLRRTAAPSVEIDAATTGRRSAARAG